MFCYLYSVSIIRLSFHNALSVVWALSSDLSFFERLIMYSLMQRNSLLHYSKIPSLSPRERSSPRGARRFLAFKVYTAIVVILALLLTTILLHEHRLDHPRAPTKPIPVIPENFHTVGLVFYGRRSRVEILDCYLKVFGEDPSWNFQSQLSNLVIAKS